VGAAILCVCVAGRGRVRMLAQLGRIGREGVFADFGLLRLLFSQCRPLPAVALGQGLCGGRVGLSDLSDLLLAGLWHRALCSLGHFLYRGQASPHTSRLLDSLAYRIEIDGKAIVIRGDTVARET
jgi:hypothetical protein